MKIIKLLKITLLINVCLLILNSTYAENLDINNDQEPETIGLTLSGGGARGFAHIGILHVLDSLGIEIDYVSGTSMGAIVGGMYASGYSAAEIEKKFKSIDWDAIITMRKNLEYSHPRIRETLGRHIINIPIEKGSIALASGAIEGQQLWNTLGDGFFPVRTIDDFSKLPIPFACVATDLETGDAVVMKDGDIVTAVRASMSIPTIFTAVERDGKKLVDGGIVLNFPVNVIKDMGADFVIGVNVSEGLRTADELTSPIDVLMQMGFFKGAQTYPENIKNTDIYIEPDIKNFTASNFRNIHEIIEIGKQTGRLYIDDLKEVLEHKKPAKGISKTELKEPLDEFIVDSIVFHGLTNIRSWFVEDNVKIAAGDTITSSIINNNINKLYASGYFNRITYNLVADGDKTRGTLEFIFEESAFTNLYFSFNYSTFMGVGFMGEMTIRKFLFYNTSLYTKALVGEMPAVKAGLDIFTGDSRKTWINMEARGNYLVFPLHKDFRYIAEYNRLYYTGELTFNMITGEDSYLTTGAAYYMQNLTPSRTLENHLKGSIHSFKILGGWKINSLDKHAFSRSGQLVSIDAAYFIGQSSSLSFHTSDGEVTSDLSEAGIEQSDFLQTAIRWESNVFMNEKLTAFSQFQGGYNFFYDQDFLNMFNMGGTANILDNQITFAGLTKYDVNSSSIFAGGLGLQYNLWEDLYLTPLVNLALYDFKLMEMDLISMDNFVFGAGTVIGYDAVVGPIEITVSYSPQKGNVLAYLNLGWSF